MADDIVITAYSKAYARADFSCGKPKLDEWLKTQASQQQRSGNTRTFLAVSQTEDRVVGYYSTTTFRLDLDDAAAAYGAGRRRYPVPAVLLARLAVDEQFQGRTIGVRLLIHAFTEIAMASRSVGFEVLVVHAIDPEAVTFYAKAGFTKFVDRPLHLFMPLQDLLATLAAN